MAMASSPLGKIGRYSKDSDSDDEPLAFVKTKSDA